MSLVHEALKKANSSPSSAPKSTTGLGPEIMVGQRKSRSPLVPLFLALFALLIAGPILAPILTRPNGGGSVAAQRLASAPEQTPASNRLGQFAMEEVPLPRSAFQQARPAPAIVRPALDLSGIVYSGSSEGSYCLINGEVFRVGDQVGPMQITQISKDEVVLDRDGQKIILAVGDKV